MDFNGSEEKKKEDLCTHEVFIRFWKTNIFFTFIYFQYICLSFKISNFFPFFFKSSSQKRNHRVCQICVSEVWDQMELGHQKVAQIPSGLGILELQLGPTWCMDSCFGFMELPFTSSFSSASWILNIKLSSGTTLPKSPSKATPEIIFYGQTHFNVFKHKSLDVLRWRCLEILSREVFKVLWFVSGPLLSCLNNKGTIYSSCSKACCVCWMNFIHIRNWLRFLKLIVFSVLP